MKKNLCKDCKHCDRREWNDEVIYVCESPSEKFCVEIDYDMAHAWLEVELDFGCNEFEGKAAQ